MKSEPFTLPSGESVQVRPLSGFEAVLARKKYPDDDVAYNAFMLSCAMDIPESAALEWMKNHLAGDFKALVDEIQDRSGLGQGADKSTVRGI